ncbi:hypothetical protein OG264_15960 [Streptomyces xanthophaeus]|nr:hypothetical protein OG264_15960 [Streptomyces xanthophaeus]WST62171.1 hypothetical protein OG605_22475 [Streptomyces xanthophaeus]
MTSSTSESPADDAVQVLVHEGHHVHLVAEGDVQCVTHACLALPGA